MKSYFSPPVTWLVRRVEKAMARLADALCVLSGQQAAELVEEFGVADRRKVRITPLLIDLSHFEILPMPAWEGPLVVGWLGRFVGVKNIPLLVEVVEKSLAANPGIRFVVAGDGPEAR